MGLLILVPHSVYGLADIENKNILAESEDGEIVLFLEFGENIISKLDRIIPSLHSGLLVIGDKIVEMERSRVKLMGDSFVVHSENILIYAKGLGNNQFIINSYLLGSAHLDPIKLSTIPIESDVSSEIKTDSVPTEMIVLVQQDTKTFWNENYDIEIKVFDKAKNPKPQFYQSLGTINQAEINVTLKNIDGVELTQLTGQTNSKGYWQGNYFFPQNLVSGGTYLVEVNVAFFESNNFQEFETFFISDTGNAKSSG